MLGNQSGKRSHGGEGEGLKGWIFSEVQVANRKLKYIEKYPDLLCLIPLLCYLKFPKDSSSTRINVIEKCLITFFDS